MEVRSDIDEVMGALRAFGAKCVELQLAPRPLLPRSVRELRATGTLDLSKQGIGDDYAIALSAALARLGTRLKALRLDDNRLGDVGMEALVRAAMPEALPSLTSLELSGNATGPASARAIRELLEHPRCALRALRLAEADIDDDECVALVESVRVNRTVERIDLRSNRIGALEGANKVNPNLLTGGEALAQQLPSNATLTALDLSWNGLRQESAASFARALGENTALLEVGSPFAVLEAVWVGDEAEARSSLSRRSTSRSTRSARARARARARPRRRSGPRS